MKNKSQFSKVLVLCFTLCTTANVLMAVIGYLMFGSKVESQITLSLPTEKLSSKVAIYATLLNPVSKYALTVTPIVHTIESRFYHSCNQRVLFSLLFKTCLVISTVVAAVTVPLFEHLMSLVGAFLGFLTSILLPCLYYLKITSNNRLIELGIIGAIMLMGIFTAIVGTYTSLKKIMRHFVTICEEGQISLSGINGSFSY
ncbi:amino acid transporter AVT1J-like [Cornus florida]|uniref:amino acid transporter AVT1J-like n=1 Tax=Cornus florida TaxID=4283 RepID=UPI00289816DE|nr:amino acid transporter AVT1J-like [Cornus florida]